MVEFYLVDIASIVLFVNRHNYLGSYTPTTLLLTLHSANKKWRKVVGYSTVNIEIMDCLG